VRDLPAACEAARAGGRGLIEEVVVNLGNREPAVGSYVNAGFVFATDGPGGASSVPVVGEHSSEVLGSLGYSEAQIRALIGAEIVREQR
jgi:crotonobetainyl-CoA:carnitine CoA-transferase CaiB-like acyl-CoA transferase